VIPQRDALRLQLAALYGREPDGGLIEVRTLGAPVKPRFFPGGEWAAIIDTALTLAQRGNVNLGAAPRRRQSGCREAIERVWMLWADVDTPEAVDRLRKFRPAPSIVIRSGTPGHLHAWWSLREPLTTKEAEEGNRRLAKHLGADLQATAASTVLRAAGTLNHKQNPPLPVECVSLEVGRAPTAAEVLANVPMLDPPRPARVMRIAPPPAADDALRGIPATDYVPALVGCELVAGKVPCPFHEDRTPSLHCYPDDGGWHCFGCGAGGSIIDFGAGLYDIEPRGSGYHEIRRRLAGDLLRGVGVAA
jgi:hypothetical protein